MARRYAHITSTIFSSLCFCFFLPTVYSELPQDQKSIMVSLYDMIHNNTGTSFAWNGTNRGSDPCSWKGVSCSPNNSSITNISLHLFSISNPDTLPLLCGIKSLESLDVSGNQLSSIPGGFITGCGGMSGLKVLNFSSNLLEGPLSIFSGFGVLESLDLSMNSLSGNIDLQLDSLSSLKNLDLSSNKFGGHIPTSLGKSNALVELQLSANSFDGEIPSQIVKYENLSLIDLSLNKLSGPIPESLGDLSSLKTLSLSANRLSGTIPKTLGNITTLLRFSANQNGFVGDVPAGITSYLNNLDLSYNSLSGTIPWDLLSPSNLQYVDLSNNKLEGSIPANMGSTLVRLRLGSNSLAGPIPSKPFQSLQNLTFLELENNQLNGSIPLELLSCKNLALLNLAHNKLAGPLPADIGNLISLQVLKLEMNGFVGGVPDSISKLKILQRLNMSWNSLTGVIPDSISTLHTLTNLDLRENGLNGSIPNSIGNLNLLLELQLGNNQLSGLIPEMPMQLQIALNLSHNLFTGPIPTTLTRLTALEVLDLSNNTFSGQIPESMTRMSGLTHLILANNHLSGVVPAFPNYVELSLEGNRQLIFPPPPPQNSPVVSGKKKLSVAVVIVIAVAVAVIAVGVFTCIALSVLRNMYKVRGYWLVDDHHTHHNSQLDFSKAMAVTRRPTNTLLSTEWYTYYRAVMPSGISYFIKKINWSNKAFTLHDPEKFVEELTRLASVANPNIMTPLAYVLTSHSAFIFHEFPEFGSLFHLLHSDDNNVLDWKSRFSIALGISRGLNFLHGNGSEDDAPRILLNLSTRSIMMKSLSEPIIGDFELSNLIRPSHNKRTPSVVAAAVGFVPPEYAYTMRVTTSGNIYSFGVIMLELLTGKQAVYEGIELASWVTSRSDQPENLEEIIDRRVGETSMEVQDQMVASLRIALRCISTSPSKRPDAEALLQMLLDLAKYRKSKDLRRYLGLPSVLGRYKSATFRYIEERIRERIGSWQNKLLSKAGKEVLLKSIAQSLPIFTMSSTDSCLRHYREAFQSLLVGGGGGGSRGIHWLSWKRLCEPKCKGGLGFKCIHEFNKAHLQNSGARGFKDGVARRIGNGEDTRIWGWGWLSNSTGTCLTTPCIEELKEAKVKDSWRWMGDTRGCYTVKHGYRLLTASSTRENNDAMFKAWRFCGLCRFHPK
ncbi:PREDICTED: leucine-rich repeat receptor-like tyrosine-protein kinase PXC3 [Ipomoea nil]|uniref:leucine-rich repeat receptor-like tyrosine-protein kinase PXC3 n=1 Tax=Ipomoea nil TaxID=35883 RepID=UPI0009010C75|nr:PREDICTED: leucine-rich repeat receptor-like tyrosine-protein kinase PXC3 [Ipomoea nil]